jgi:hypothetical protein
MRESRRRRSAELDLPLACRPKCVSAKQDGGDGGIRTLDRALQPYNGLANRRLQPLGHISGKADMPDAGASRKRQISRCRIPSHLTTAGRLTEALKQIPGAEAGTSGPRICRVRRKCGPDWATLGLRIFYPRRFGLRVRSPRGFRFAFADGRVGRFSKTSRGKDMPYVTNPSPCLDRAASQRCCER